MGDVTNEHVPEILKQVTDLKYDKEKERRKIIEEMMSLRRDLSKS